MFGTCVDSMSYDRIFFESLIGSPLPCASVILLLMHIPAFILYAPKKTIRAISEKCSLMLENAMTEYNREVTEESELTQNKIELFNDHLDKIWSQIELNAKKLAGYYQSKDILYPDYRNLKAVRRIHQYLSSKRVDNLTGRDGAYNLYENEIRIENIADSVGCLTRVVSDKLSHVMVGLESIVFRPESFQYAAV